MIRKPTTLMLSLLLTGWSTAMAQDVICDSSNSSFANPFEGPADNIEVPPGEPCFLGNVTIDNVKVFGRRLLTGLGASGPTVIRGSVQGEPGHGVVQLARAIVDGDVQIIGGVGLGGLPHQIFRSTIHGNVQVMENTAPIRFFLVRSTIDGDLQVFDNLWGTPTFDNTIVRNLVGGDLQLFKNIGAFTVGDNTIGGNLQCKDNTPDVVPASVGPLGLVGGPNTVGGVKEDQCSEDLGF